ncbi:hypothetical protein BDA96_03G264700 [Sorghum bicolor]|uniref:Uncharacterized protein n=2 Tax=Sorghum bicolor TaxID=4558 RepID=A0A921UNX6_SORBI|nr:hypothetical protein BDA96_03G264700 [Sorghum bicolor]OQU87268.1 hypothetical protein SORBI_3003G244401 [Sorghum bicolor]
MTILGGGAVSDVQGEARCCKEELPLVGSPLAASHSVSFSSSHVSRTESPDYVQDLMCQLVCDCVRVFFSEVDAPIVSSFQWTLVSVFQRADAKCPRTHIGSAAFAYL